MFETLRNKNRPFARIYRSLSVAINDLIRKYSTLKLWLYHICNKNLRSQENLNTIVSLTSFPARIEKVWVTIESLFKQTQTPSKIILVLSTEEFPNKQLPEKLKNQEKRGLQIIWTQDNLRSYKKFVPVKLLYPNYTIITVDDDVFYKKNFLKDLLAISAKNPTSLVGSRGKIIEKMDGQFLPYRNWRPVRNLHKGQDIILTGVGGIVYPPGLLLENLLLDTKTALDIAPYADDIYFWAVTMASDVDLVCLGKEKFLSTSKDNHNNSLSRRNVFMNENDIQLANVIDHFSQNGFNLNRF